MTAADDVKQARALARLADELYYRSAYHAEPDVDGCLRRAEVLYQGAQAHAAIAWASIVDDPDLPHPGEYVTPVRGVPTEPVPLEDYRPPTGLGRFKSKAAADAPATADQHDPTTHQEEES